MSIIDFDSDIKLSIVLFDIVMESIEDKRGKQGHYTQRVIDKQNVGCSKYDVFATRFKNPWKSLIIR